MMTSASTRRLVLFTLLCMPAVAQWIDFREPGMPRTRDGKINMTAPPKTVDGKPDLTGVWMHTPTPPDELRRLYKNTFYENELEVLPPGMNIELQTKYSLDLLIDYDAEIERKPDELPTALMRPAGIEAQRRVFQEVLTKAPANPCDAETVSWPLVGLLSEPLKLIQAPREMVILYEVGNLHRQVFMDGRKFPEQFDLPAYLGYSVGRWEGDTFVVETRGFKDGMVLDPSGHPRSDQMRITERFRRRDFGHLDVEMTFDDPKFYTQAWTVSIPHVLVPDNDIFEMFCENEKDMKHIK